MDRDFVERHSAEFELKDGTRVLLRPVVPEDRDLFIAAFGRLSDETIERRFMTKLQRLTDDMLTYLTVLDYDDHFAWGVLALDEPGPPGIAVGRYVRSNEDPDSAEAAITVVDSYQGRGLGTLLLHVLAVTARDHGIKRFRSYLSSENRKMIGILKDAGSPMKVDSPGVMVSDVELDALAGRLAEFPDHEAIVAAAGGRSKRENGSKKKGTTQ